MPYHIELVCGIVSSHCNAANLAQAQVISVMVKNRLKACVFLVLLVGQLVSCGDNPISGESSSSWTQKNGILLNQYVLPQQDIALTSVATAPLSDPIADNGNGAFTKHTHNCTLA